MTSRGCDDRVDPDDGVGRVWGRVLLIALLLNAPLKADENLHQSGIDAMVRAARYFQTHVAANGGYLWAYKTDFSMREGERSAAPTTIWVEPPVTPSVGMAFVAAYEATGDTLFLNGAVGAARALVWGQLASGGWDYRIDFDPGESKRWHYRRDVERGDAESGERRNRTTLDDDNTQSALRLLMRVDKALDFSDQDIGDAVQYGLDALLKAVIDALDERGRWVETGQLRNPENRRERIPAEIISCRTFNRNLTLLAQYVRSRP